MTTLRIILLAIALTVLMVATAQAQTWFTNGLVAYYPFNGNANDASGNGNSGTPSGTTLVGDRFGNSSKAYRFNGTNAYIQVSRLVTSSQPFSWSVWFRPDFSQTNGIGVTLLSQGEPPIRISPAISISGGAVVFYSYDFQPHNIWGRIRARWDTNKWYQVVVTSDISGNRLLFVDGQIEATAAGVPFGEQNSYLYIGANMGQCCQNYFSGDIDDVRIYSRSLSTNEVSLLYYYESPRSVALVKSYTLDFTGLILGANYQLQFATNLNSWSNWGAPFTATSDRYTNAIPHQRVDEWTKLFFRLVPQ